MARRGPARAELLMKAANWWWAPGETSKPVPDAPFWDMTTYWGNKAAWTLLYGGLGALAGFAVVAATGLPVVVVLALAVIGAAIVSLDPDSKLARAARQ
ncbi:MAG: hypothetical protein M5R40_07380 [Anaerolineae bacterium]|nr:hypothetical protein [Anaerolineae bacterium]